MDNNDSFKAKQEKRAIFLRNGRKNGKANIQKGFLPKTIEAKTETQKEEKMMRGVKKNSGGLKKHQELIKPKRFSF